METGRHRKADDGPGKERIKDGDIGPLNRFEDSNDLEVGDGGHYHKGDCPKEM